MIKCMDIHTKLRITSMAVVFQDRQLVYVRCIWPWMNHSHPVWWSTITFMFVNGSWCVNLVKWRGIFYWFIASIHVFIHFCLLLFLSNDFYLEMSFYNRHFVLSYVIFHRRSVCSYWRDYYPYPHRNNPRQPPVPLVTSLIARFMGSTWGPAGADRTQVGPMWAP